MSQSYVGEIRPFGGNFAPRNWHFCDGALLSIAEYQALFTLIGTTFGGNGTTTFALPDLRGRTAIGQGQGPGLTQRTLGESAGSEEVTVNANQLPGHTHILSASTGTGTTTNANGMFPGTPDSATALLYLDATTGTSTDAPPATGSVLPSGQSMPHGNIMPSLVISYIISLQGIFPSRN